MRNIPYFTIVTRFQVADNIIRDDDDKETTTMTVSVQATVNMWREHPREWMIEEQHRDVLNRQARSTDLASIVRCRLFGENTPSPEKAITRKIEK